MNDTAWLGHALIALFDHTVLSIMRWTVLFRFPKVTARYLILKDQTWPPNPVLPKTVNDKYFWRKVFDRNPEFPVICDKLQVGDWMRRHGADVASAQVLWTGTDPGDIPESLWRPGGILKANHGSGWNVVLQDPMPDKDAVYARARYFMKTQYGSQWYERFYFDVDRKLFIEEFLPDLRLEMKFYTFGSDVQRVFVRYFPAADARADVWRLDENGKLYLTGEKSSSAKIVANQPVPPVAEEALAAARLIGENFDHMRVDFLSDGERFWVGELTICNLGGHIDGMKAESAARLNAAWDIRKSWFLTSPQSGWRRFYKAILLRRLNARSA